MIRRLARLQTLYTITSCCQALYMRRVSSQRVLLPHKNTYTQKKGVGCAYWWVTAASVDLVRSSLAGRVRRWSPVARRLRSRIPVIRTSLALRALLT